MLTVLGTVVLAYGAWGLLAHAAETRPPRAALWLLGGVLLHDAVLAPGVLLVGALTVRLVPEAVRAPVQAALYVSGVLVLVALPLLSGRGAAVDAAPSPTDLLRVLLVVWVTAAVAAGLGLARRRGRRAP